LFHRLIETPLSLSLFLSLTHTHTLTDTIIKRVVVFNQESYLDQTGRRLNHSSPSGHHHVTCSDHFEDVIVTFCKINYSLYSNGNSATHISLCDIYIYIYIYKFNRLVSRPAIADDTVRKPKYLERHAYKRAHKRCLSQ